MKVNDKNLMSLYSFLGLCMKAGKLSSGEVGTQQSITSGKAKLVIISQDASENTTNDFKNKCDYYKVPYVVFGDKENLGRAIGKSERTSLVVCDNGFAKAFREKLQKWQDGGDLNGENKNI